MLVGRHNDGVAAHASASFFFLSFFFFFALVYLSAVTVTAHRAALSIDWKRPPMARLRAGRARPSASQAARLQIKSRHYGKLCANPRRMGSAREKRKRISTPVGAFHCSIVNDSVNETAELIRSRSKTSRNRRNNPVVFLTQNSRDGIIQFFPPSVRNSWSDGTFYYKKTLFLESHFSALPCAVGFL